MTQPNWTGKLAQGSAGTKPALPNEAQRQRSKGIRAQASRALLFTARRCMKLARQLNPDVIQEEKSASRAAMDAGRAAGQQFSAGLAVAVHTDQLRRAREARAAEFERQRDQDRG